MLKSEGRVLRLAKMIFPPHARDRIRKSSLWRICFIGEEVSVTKFGDFLKVLIDKLYYKRSINLGGLFGAF